jgi:hypothetical protein
VVSSVTLAAYPEISGPSSIDVYVVLLSRQV